MKSLAAAKSYAKALFALAKERNQAEAIGRELADAVEQLDREPAVKTLFGRPGAAAAKRGAAVEIAGRLEVSKLMSDFLVLVATHGRGDQFAAIAAAYRDLLDADLGRRSEEHTSELQSRLHLVCRLLLEKKKKNIAPP